MYVQFAEGMALFHLVFVPYIARQSYVSKKVFLIIWRDGICARPLHSITNEYIWQALFDDMNLIFSDWTR